MHERDESRAKLQSETYTKTNTWESWAQMQMAINIEIYIKETERD